MISKILKFDELMRFIKHYWIACVQYKKKILYSYLRSNFFLMHSIGLNSMFYKANIASNTLVNEMCPKVLTKTSLQCVMLLFIQKNGENSCSKLYIH